MTKRYALTETAESELGSILRFVADQDGIDRALHLHEKFVEAFQALADTPGIGFKRPHLTGDRIRWHAVFRFIVIYDPDASPVVVLRVLHGARELDRILSQRH